jgi:hypothetical protein
VEQVLPGSWYQHKGKGYKERCRESECSETIRYSCMKMKKMRPLETISRMRGWGNKVG